MKRNIRLKKNPFRNFFLYAVAFCCLTLSVIFFCISYMNNKEIQQKEAQDKADLIMGDFEEQLEMMEDIAFRIASNYEFQPFYFKENVAREIAMLEAFKQYQYYVTLTEEYFLYYGDDWIYRSSGHTLDLDIYLQTKSAEESERERFRNVLQELLEDPISQIKVEARVVPVFDEVYVFIPIKVNKGSELEKGILAFSIEKSALGRRFQVVGGIDKECITLYCKEGILYQEDIGIENKKNVIKVVSSDELYTMYFLPNKRYDIQNGLFWLLFLLVFADTFLVITVANIFAHKAYSPILGLTEKYRGKTAEQKEESDNALMELENMMESMVQSNIEAGLQIQKRQSILRNQFLCMLLEGSATLDVLTYLEKVDICLPGPLFCVISISFEENVTEEFLSGLQKELEQVPDAEEAEYVYTICSYPKKLINAICSYETEDQKNELAEIICEVAEGFGHKLEEGIGNSYNSLTNLPASWLESMDEIHNKLNHDKSQESIYDYERTRWIYEALETGNEEESLRRFNSYIEQLNKKPMSLLVQQYIMVNFLGELGKLGKKYQLELSKKNISMLISAKNMKDFEIAGKNAIHDFCEKLNSSKNQMKEEESLKIFEYIREHFTEYDLSQEKVAADLNVSTAAVRQAVMTHTGKMYKDYLIQLRIDYAKELLIREDIQVAEVCERVGYGNVSHFIKLFREMTGLTPSKFRRDCSIRQRVK